MPVALGRHALGLIAQDVRARGISHLAVPAYRCLTMVTPFQLEGFHLADVAVGPDLMAEPDALSRLVRGDPPGSWAVLHCEVFGAAPSPALSRVLADLRRAGAVLILDETHRWPLPPQLPADYAAASIRKLTGLPDGAFAWGGALGRPGGPAPRPRAPLDEAATRAWLSGDADRSEDLMDLQLTPVGMSSAAAAGLASLAPGLPAAIEARRAAVGRLHEGLAARGLPPVSPPDGHFCVAVRDPAGGPHARRAVESLARSGVDGPVWWPRPSGWSRPWPEDLVTLPVDEGDPRALARLLDMVGRLLL